MTRTEDTGLVTVTLVFDDGTWEVRHEQSLADVQRLVRTLIDGEGGIANVSVWPRPVRPQETVLGDLHDAT